MDSLVSSPICTILWMSPARSTLTIWPFISPVNIVPSLANTIVSAPTNFLCAIYLAFSRRVLGLSAPSNGIKFGSL
jgi:hypothetical protein